MSMHCASPHWSPASAAMRLIGNQRYECFAQAASARALGGGGPADADQAFPVVFVRTFSWRLRTARQRWLGCARAR
jgi:hypothetical protein